VRKALLATAGLVALGAALAAPASADGRHCYSFHSNLPVVGQLDTTEQCIFLPIDPELR
jgi:hypothetical protein